MGCASRVPHVYPFIAAYKLFGCPSEGITLDRFRDRLASMNLVMSEGDLRATFDRYDKDSSGAVSFSELANALFYRPAPGGELWTVAADVAVRGPPA